MKKKTAKKTTRKISKPKVLAAPYGKPTPQLEKDIEKAIGLYAKQHGCMYMKFTSPSQRAVPDRMIITKDGIIGFLEVKRAGQVPTKLQAIKMAELKQQGCNVTWCDNVGDGKVFVDRLRLMKQSWKGEMLIQTVARPKQAQQLKAKDEPERDWDL